MTNEQLLKNLQVPSGKVDVVLDTDAYNEIDDQFAISYLLRSKEKLNTVALYAAPFFNGKSSGPADGMQKSYDEILHIVDLCGEDDLKKVTFKGSTEYLPDERTPVESAAASDLASRAMNYSSDLPLYVVAIGAITNVASALLMNPKIAENIVVVWLGGNARHWCDNWEFNLQQDIAAARVVMQSGAPFVQLPCAGVVTEFRLSGAELEFWLKGKNPLADYLARNTVEEAESYAKGKPWTRVIWDVTAVAWLLNEHDRFMNGNIVPTLLPSYNHLYEVTPTDSVMCYVRRIDRDNLMDDLIKKLLK